MLLCYSYWVLQYDGELLLGLDVGCGNGQCSALLSPHFKQILATDISSAQIEVAKTLNHPSNVEFQYYNHVVIVQIIYCFLFNSCFFKGFSCRAKPSERRVGSVGQLCSSGALVRFAALFSRDKSYSVLEWRHSPIRL